MMFPNQTFFYCKHKRGKEFLFKIVETKMVPVGDKDTLEIITFQCPDCKHEFLYKISLLNAKQFLSGQNQPAPYTR